MSTTDHLSDLRFADLALAEPVMKGIAETGYEFCTPIQAETLPLLLQGKDVAGQGQTGTGKTAAFLLATLHRIVTTEALAGRDPKSPRALILAPTRELAIQIHKDAVILSKFCDINLGLAYGGTDYEKQRETIASGIDILIGTPGRVIDFFKQKVFSLEHTDIIVLDEADRMFDLGFINDIRFVLRRLPAHEKRLNLLFSATLSNRVLELAYEHMNDPVKVEIEPEQVTAERVRQAAYYTANDEKLPLLLGMLKANEAKGVGGRAMVFINTKRSAEQLNHWLPANGIEVGMISGDVPQNKRQRLLQEFKDGKISVLIATDVAARGLHIDGVTHVFNYDLPDDAEDYVHRIGRTARAGAEGDAISFVCETFGINLPAIEKYVGNKIPREFVQSEQFAEDVQKPPVPRRDRGGPGGRGPNGSGRGGPRRGGPNGGGQSRGGGGRNQSRGNRPAGNRGS